MRRVRAAVMSLTPVAIPSSAAELRAPMRFHRDKELFVRVLHRLGVEAAQTTTHGALNRTARRGNCYLALAGASLARSRSTLVVNDWPCASASISP